MHGAAATPETMRYAAQALCEQLNILDAQLKSTGVDAVMCSSQCRMRQCGQAGAHASCPRLRRARRAALCWLRPPAAPAVPGPACLLLTNKVSAFLGRRRLRGG